MRWDKLFGDFDSQWDAEVDNAEFDERRELVRADRAITPFVEVLAQWSSTRPIVVVTGEAERLVHCARVGVSWLDGFECSTGHRVIVPFRAVTRISSVISCDCAIRPVRYFAHVTLGAVIRELERNSTGITVLIPHGGVRGKVRAVWRDAIEVGRGEETSLVPIGAIDRIVIDGA